MHFIARPGGVLNSRPLRWVLDASIVVLLVLMNIVMCASVSAQAANIKNDEFWHTVEGQPVYSQGGGIFSFKDPATGKLSYFWYGVHYKEADKYLADPSVTGAKSSFKSVTCYRSDNLVDWHFMGDVLDQEALDREPPTWVGRLGVAYIKSLKVYAMFVQHGGHVLIATAEAPTGQFAWNRQIDMTSMIGTSNTGDQTVFTDPDTGISYLVYSYGRGRGRIYVSEIGVKDGVIGLLDCTEIYHGVGREGNCMFKYKDKYYMCASNLYGWDGSYPYYLVADNIRGPFTPVNNMLVMNGATDDYAHISQTGFFVTVKGSQKETVVYCGDRWSDFAGNGLGYNVWCPVSFENGAPWFNSLSSWRLDAQTGDWQVAPDNNYVKNGSFEADRRHIPSPVKPVQEDLMGWTTKVLKGNPVKIGEPDAPVLNHFNDRLDRQQVTGEKSLRISDSRDFSRKVYQVIQSTAQVHLPDGVYQLSAKIRTDGPDRFKRLAMYASSATNHYQLPIENLNGSWKSIHLTNILIKNGQITIGFDAEGAAGACCYIDDVVLTSM